MQNVLHKNDTRGFADHGWLIARHSFSFANYYDVNRMHFGVLRVLNDDIIAPGMGFGTHPHNDMEIITIPLKGALAHKDNIGGGGVIKSGEIQVMSAGSGIAHSEFNASDVNPVNLLQIWVFPNKKGVQPRYAQEKYELRENDFTQIIRPHDYDAVRNALDTPIFIYQNAWFYLADFRAGFSKKYDRNLSQNGLYIFVISGEILVNGENLSDRDGLGIVSDAEFLARTDAKFLVMEVPMR